MSLTIHDLRVSLRDKSKNVEELEKKLGELRADLDKKNTSLKENIELVKKKDEIISIKELVIKEKDVQIQKLEVELANLKKLTSQIKQENMKPPTATSTNLNKLAPLSNVKMSKSKRVAISAEPAQNRFNKSKDLRVSLVEYQKSDRFEWIYSITIIDWNKFEITFLKH